MIYFVILVLIFLITLFCYLQNNLIDITEYNIESEKIKNEILIVQLSDMHSKQFHKAVNKVKEQKPDLILITGDYINDKCKNKSKMLENRMINKV